MTTLPEFRWIELTANRMSFVGISCDAKLVDKVPRSLYRVQCWCMLLRGLKKHDSRGGGEGVPTDLRGKLTESQLHKSKKLAKRRRQKNRTKSRAKKGSKMWQNPEKATFDTKNSAKATFRQNLRERRRRKQHGSNAINLSRSLQRTKASAG